jgi:IS1 family transposase
MHMHTLAAEKRVLILQMLCEGSSMRAISRVVGVSINTVTKLLVQAGEACEAFHDAKVHGLQSKQIQADEIWAFCSAKSRNTPAEKKDSRDYGSVWTYTAIDRDSKLIITWLVGDRTREATRAFVGDMAKRVDSHPQITTDAANPYLPAMVLHFEERADYAQLDKQYSNTAGNNSPERRYSPGVCVGAKRRKCFGNPDPAMVSTSHVERHNLTMRMSMRRFTRLTNAHSKKFDNHCHALALYFAWYNWVRPNMALKNKTPAMAAGLTDEKMTMADIVRITDEYTASKRPDPTFTVRPLKEGGYVVVMDPNAYAPTLNIGEFATEAEAVAWVENDSREWFVKLRSGSGM